MNPKDPNYTPKHLAVQDDPKRPYKAYAATAMAFVASFVGAWILDTDPFTAKEAGAAFLQAAVVSGLTGGATFKVSNPKVSARA